MSQRILDTGNKIAVQAPSPSVNKNMFDMSHDFKFSFNIGQLIPACVLEVLPDDNISLNTEALLRMQPMLAPILHRLSIRSEWFFCANRVLWPNWEDFISPPVEGVDGPAAPFLSNFTVVSNSLGDYLGLPLGSWNNGDGGDPSQIVNALPFSAYQRIWWDWYRDEDFQPLQWPYAGQLVDGDNSEQEELFPIRIRNNDRDYFTSAKPWPQKGASVVIPAFVGDLPVSQTTAYDGSGNAYYKTSGANATTGDPTLVEVGGQAVLEDASGAPIRLGLAGALQVSSDDLLAQAGTIEQLRMANALQRFLEADSRGGTRYVELLWRHFKAYLPDKIDRSEYIGNTVQPISISEVLNTTGTTDAPQGTMTGHGISAARHATDLSYHAVEHGWLICICSVIPATGYYQGIPKMWSRFDRFDYAWPEFAHLGEQPILNQELFYDTASVDPDTGNTATWGYLPRYTEYKSQMNRVAGDFRTSLDYWHLARKFASLPALAQEFLEISQGADMDRIFAVIDPTVQHVLVHWFHAIKVHRALPRIVTPDL